MVVRLEDERAAADLLRLVLQVVDDLAGKAAGDVRRGRELLVVFALLVVALLRRALRGRGLADDDEVAEVDADGAPDVHRVLVVRRVVARCDGRLVRSPFPAIGVVEASEGLLVGEDQTARVRMPPGLGERGAELEVSGGTVRGLRARVAAPAECVKIVANGVCADRDSVPLFQRFGEGKAAVVLAPFAALDFDLFIRQPLHQGAAGLGALTGALYRRRHQTGVFPTGFVDPAAAARLRAVAQRPAVGNRAAEQASPRSCRWAPRL